jgi:flagellar hook-basal body complex protein FliE
MEISSLVAQNYAASKSAMAPDPRHATSGFTAVAQDFMATLRASESTAMQAMTTGADPHALVQALAQTELAVQTAISVRDRVVEAYQEILRMPV